MTIGAPPQWSRNAAAAMSWTCRRRFCRHSTDMLNSSLKGVPCRQGWHKTSLTLPNPLREITCPRHAYCMPLWVEGKTYQGSSGTVPYIVRRDRDPGSSNSCNRGRVTSRSRSAYLSSAAKKAASAVFNAGRNIQAGSIRHPWPSSKQPTRTRSLVKRTTSPILISAGSRARRNPPPLPLTDFTNSAVRQLIRHLRQMILDMR